MRAALVRFGAPAAFLAAATVALLLVRATLVDEPTTATATRRPVATTTAGPAGARARPARAPRTAQERYEIRAGDTLGAVAARYGTSVDALLALNPGLDPTGLQVGQRIRVK